MLKFQHWPRPTLVVAALLLVLTVAAVDLLTGAELSFFVFYFIPVSFAAWNFRTRWALTTPFLCVAAWLGVEILSGRVYSHPGLLAANTLIRGFSYFVIGYFVSNFKQSRVELKRYAAELETRVAQRTTKLQERVAELETFSYSLSHNLRAPLRAMEGMAYAAEESLADKCPEDLRLYLDRIRSSSIRMDRLIHDLVEYVQLTIVESEMKLVSVGPLLFEVLAHYRSEIEQKGARITVESEMPTVWGHNRMLHSVLTNLVSNAIKFSKPAENPVVSIFSQDVPGGRVRILIRDEGIGIAREYHEQIFGIFEQLHPYDVYGGTGMGLALSRKCIEKMGGRIGCDSEPCRGATFWVELRKHRPGSETVTND